MAKQALCFVRADRTALLASWLSQQIYEPGAKTYAVCNQLERPFVLEVANGRSGTVSGFCVQSVVFCSFCLTVVECGNSRRGCLKLFKSVDESAEAEFLNAGYRYALSLCANHQDAEDLVHDAWIRLEKRYRNSPQKPLLFRTIRNLYIDQYRRSRKVRFTSFDEAGIDPKSESFEDAYMNTEEVQILLGRLRDVEREALYLSVVEGYTADEIATMTDSARGTVLSLVHRSRLKLRKWTGGESGEVTERGSVIELRGREESE